MSKNLLYSLKIWLTSALLAPVFYLVIMSVKQAYTGNNHNDFSETYFLLVVFGLLFSFITWLIFFLSIVVICTYAPTETIARGMVCGAGVVLVLATFMLTVFKNGFSNDDDLIYLMLANCLCIGTGSWIYNLTLLRPAA